MAGPGDGPRMKPEGEPIPVAPNDFFGAMQNLVDEYRAAIERLRELLNRPERAERNALLVVNANEQIAVEDNQVEVEAEEENENKGGEEVDDEEAADEAEADA